MRLNEYEIVIEPNEIIFDQIQPNAVFTRTLNIKNVGNKGKRMELFRPSNKVFRLIFKQPELPVPPGMEIAAVVEFETPIGQEYNDKMVISIDNREIEIPIHAYPAKPVLVFDDVIDFGTLSAINKTVSKQLKITNQGALDGEFLIEYNGKLPISFSPSREIVPAYSTLTLTVDIFTKTPGKYEENIKVNFQSGQSKNLKLRANLMKRALILQDSKNSQPIKKLEFGSCYYGCNLLSLVMLYNASPDRVDYVIILEENGVGTELGTDLSKSTNALRSEKNEYDEKDFAPIGKLVSAFPNNGTLQPFERRPIFLRFSPQYKNPDSGFSTILKPPPRRDYAIFLYFELLGDSSNNRTELAITGTALPVLLRVIPNRMDFGNCTIGEKREMQAVLYNDSELKDVRFKFRKVANYTVLPASGRIKARSNKNVTVSFVPHQMGACNYDLICEVIDKMAELDNPLVSLDKMICQYSIHLSGYSLLLSNIPEPKYSGGIMPLITNEVGINVNTSVSSLKSFMPKAAVQNAPNDSLHSTSYSKKFKSAEDADAYKVAFPNDRAKSIGPFDRKEKYKTIFTGVDRYNYIDPDYAYTNEEIEAIENHKRIYKKYLNDLHFYRQETWKTKEFKVFNDVINAGLKPSGGLKPQMPSLTDLHEEAAKPPKFNVDPNWKLMTTEELQSQQKAIKNLKSNNNSATFNSLPITEKNKLSTILAPAQIYKIIVSPSIVDFGEVCVNSVSAKNMEFYNTLDQPIHVELEINCSELAQTNTTSQIISQQSKGTFQILFESEYVQSFQRSISYRINFSYRHHIIIQADCKLPSLKLNTNHLVLNQIGDVQPEFCYRSNITILNPFNSTAEFSWIPIFGEQGTAFSIRPASGTIEPYRDLECEVVWHGSFLAPLKGTFTLQVAGGESATLTCEAKLGQAQLHFINRRASFGKIPINMTSIKTFYMTNVGSHNAYFQVLDPRPMQGMVIKPSFGLAPVNGLTPIRVEISPKEVLKFDARVMLQIRGGKQLELRLSGESEDPAIDIDLPSFDFGGVYSGATSALPFKIINKSLVKSKIEFNLKRYPDFFIKTKEKSLNALSVNDQIYEVEIQSNQTLEMELNFSPNEVASYDFDLPIFINRTLLNSQSDQAIDQYNLSQLNSALSPYYEKMTESEQQMREKTPMTRKSGSRVTTAQHQFLKRRVTAVGLRHALHLSSSTINFRIPIRYFENLKEGGFYEAKSTMLINQSHRPVKWCFDLRRSNKVLEDGIFKVCDGSMVPFISNDKKSYGPEGEIQPNESYELKILFCPDKPGTYKCNLPIVINNNFEHPYYNIEVVGELLSPEIHFDPDVLIFKPVPLGVEISDQILIKQRGYESKSKLRLEIPESKTIDGDMVKVIEAKFVNEPIINPSDETPIELAVKFCSLKPISNQAKLRFVDDQNREYFFTVIFTADNSLFTCYSFMAEHNNDYRVVLEPDNAMKSSRVNHSAVEHIEQGGEPILRPFTGGSRHSVGINNNSVSPTFNLDHFSSPMNQQALSVDGAMLGGTSSGMGSRFMTATNIGGSKAYEQLLFPSSDTISGVYALEILKVLQRWFRCHGWPTALHLVTIPNSFRGGVSRKPLDEGLENMPQQDAAKQENKTIYEMISHLCGRPLPAIPVGSPVPVDLAERTTLFAWQHNVLLKFLETQGGCVSHIRPEHLLDVNEFECWTDLMNRKKRDAEELSGYKKNEVEQRDTPFFSTKLFNLVSKKAWLESLLQLLKICVLNRITPKLFSSMSVPFQKDASFPEVKSDPLTSNIYSMGERILLTWLNFCYSNYKSKIWPHNEPPNKWIVNFDVDLTDSLVLAACIGAYCPFVIDGLISRMYMVADTAEKCFHNALLLVEACRRIGIDYDITSLDITDPNSIYMLLFCSYLFKKLPGYVPSANVEFKSQLHLATTRQIKISNPSAKSIFYQAILCGKGVDEFSLPHGNELLIQPKGKFNLAVEYKGNNLLPKTCYLLLVGRKRNSLCPDTLVFALNSKIDELATKKLFKLETPLYKPVEMTIDIENPYEKAAEFKVKIIESGSRNGTVRNPFIENESPVFKIKSKTTLDTINFKSFTQSISNNSKNIESDEKKEELDPNVPIYKSFFTKTESIYLEPKVKKQIVISYLPLQYIKHAGLILLSNEKVGEFIYHLEGNALLPEPSKTIIDEKSLDADRVKIIRPNNSEVKSLMLRCYAGDKIKIKLLIPVCNDNREKAIATATEMRMSEFELNRRRVHGILSSKSLLESLNSLTLNKPLPKNESSRATKSSLLTKLSDMSNESSLKFKVVCNSKNSLILPENLLINSSDVKFDDNFVPLVIQFNADRVGTSNARIELKSLPNDVRLFEIDFKVIENGVIDSNTVARLQFHSCVFDPIAQPIPIKNSSDVICNYVVDLTNRDEDGNVFKGPTKFSIKPKDIFIYELTFLPNAENKFEGEIVFNNLTEGSKIKYTLIGIGERRAPLGEIKLETRVGQISQHEIMIPNKTSKKICYYVSSTDPFIKGPEKLMILPNRKESYSFEIHPIRRGDFKGVLTFKPGEWPIKDVDSDGEEMGLDSEERPQQFTLWYTFDIKIRPSPPLSSIELDGYAFETTTLWIPLSNPLNKKLKFEVIKSGLYLEGDDFISIDPQEKINYELRFSPKQAGKFRGSLIFVNDDCGEFWYDLKLTSEDPQVIQTDIIEAEVGRYATQTLKLNNPLNEPVQFQTLISNPSNFALDRKQNECIQVEPNGKVDVNIIFTPSTLSLAPDHTCLVTFYNEKIGNISYELRGVGLQPEVQDPINITAEIGHSQMIVVNFRNSTNEPIYCDILLLDEEKNNVIESVENSFNILLNGLENVLVEAKSILDIPIVFTPTEMKRFNVNLIVTATRGEKLSWEENDSEAFAVINAISKAMPFVIECTVRKRLEKRMEVILDNTTTYASGHDRSFMKLRAATPAGIEESSSLKKLDSPNSLVVLGGEVANLASEFVHSIQFTNASCETVDLIKNSISIKLVRVQRDKSTGLVTLLFDIVFSPFRSFITDAYLQVETALGGMWRFPLKLISVEPPPDDVITIEAYRLNSESVVGFRLTSKSDKSIPFRAKFVQDQSVFSVTPSQGELLSEEENGTLIKVGFTPNSYGKTFQSYLIINTPNHQWKYLVKGIPPEYSAPRGQSAIRETLPYISKSGQRENKKRNFIIENTYIIQTAVSSPIKGASLK